jgi:imidazolonepropionase-like amidohydrolase/pimeloyl-ACP methyl ester carboxylesterase
MASANKCWRYAAFLAVRIFTIMFFAWLFSVVAVAGRASNQSASRTWITDVTIISPENLDHIGKGSVLIENDRIVSVERKAGAKNPLGATVVSGKGLFLIPGLIDSHVHLASVPGMSFDQAESKSEMIKEYFKQLPRSYLYYGYTTVVDLAVVDHQVLDDFRQAPLHPDLYSCGEPLVFANGYPMSFAPPATRFKRFPNFIYDPKQASSIPSEYKPEDHTPAVAAASVRSSGGICVKTYFERGFARDRHLPVMGPDVLADIRKAATQADLVLMIHANSFEAQKLAVEGDVDVIAHGMWHWGDLDKRPDLPAEIKQLLDQIVEKKIGYQPTFQVLQGELAYFDPEYLKIEAIPRVIPRGMLEWFNSPEGKWFKKEIVEDDTPDAAMLEMSDQGPLRRTRQVVAYLASKDANFLFGTDTPSSPTYGNLPGLNGYLEMQQLQNAGLSLVQIFKAATISNARKFKIDSQLGTIEPGKTANLVLLKKSPLENLDAYDSIVTVWVHGKPVARDSLAVNSENPALPQNATTQVLPVRTSEPVKEEMFVRIGGIDQWITIKGDDRNNPVVLFLHGGPGDAWSPFADAMFAGWEKDFTLVQWDQRGAGRTYGKSGPSIESTMTVKRMVEDGIEVAEFLTKHLNKKKIIIEGGSWGSILGIYMAHARPDLFYAYVGDAQLVNTRKEDSASYARVLELARTSGDQQAITALTAIGPPPWRSLFKSWPVFRKWRQAYQAKEATAPRAPITISPEYASPEERDQDAAADDFCFEYFWGQTMSGPLELVDLPALGTDFAIPIYIIQGEKDLTAPPDLAKAYFDSIKAPRKQFYLVPGTGHELSAAELDMILKVLVEQVRPLTLGS